MAKKAQTDSLRSYFVKMFEEHPDWLGLGSNEQIRTQFEADWGHAMTDNEAGSMSTCKSQMRKKLGISVKGKRGRKKRKGKAAASAASNGGVLAALARPSISELERLELAIDDCIDQAREVEHRRQKDLIKYLKLARREIVLMVDPS